MNKLASVALATVLGVTGIACATSANADPYFRAEVVLPRVVVEPFAYAPGYFMEGARGYWHRDYDRDRYEHHRFDRDRDHRDHDGDRRGDRR
jgi:hypothetical protein